MSTITMLGVAATAWRARRMPVAVPVMSGGGAVARLNSTATNQFQNVVHIGHRDGICNNRSDQPQTCVPGLWLTLLVP